MPNYQFIIQILVYSFILILALGVLCLVWMYYCDKIQTKHAIRHNFPVVGRMRYVLEHWGTFFRQYFFALDREEMPFNRAQRSWVYRAAKNIDNTCAFGSSRNLNIAGSVYFSNDLFPSLDKEAVSEITPPIIGPFSREPYHCSEFFHISGMSYGALSGPAVRALGAGAKKAGIWLNTGEGGVSPYHLESGCDLVCQIGTGKFGVRNNKGEFCETTLRKLGETPNIKMFELKLSQGAKPGKGGILPAEKVSPEIAKIRGIPEGEAAISPNRFPEIHTVDELLNTIHSLRELTGKPVGIKLCLGNPEALDPLCQTILTRGTESAPDFITLDSGDGGSGAAPQSLIDNVGMLIHESLPALVDTLQRFGLRERIKVIASGKLINPIDVAWALAAGADYINNARGFMFSLGCIQAMQCNKNTCPTGITTHKTRLQAGLNPTEKSVRVAHYAFNMKKEVETIAHSCGAHHPRELSRRHIRIVTEDGRSTAYP